MNRSARSAAAFDPAPAHREFEQRLLRVLPRLTPSRRRLARVLLDAPAAVAFQSAEALGKHADVDAATVVRFCRQLGYPGFAELKRSLQSDVPRFLSATDKIRQTPDRASEAENILESVLAQDGMNLERASVLNDLAAFGAAIRIVDTSERTVVLGGGISAPVGYLLAHMLRLIGVPAVHRDAEVPAAVEVAHLTPRSAVVAVGFRRYMNTTLRLFTESARRTDATICITDSKASPLTEIARVSLLAPVDAGELTNSITAPISLVNALVTGVSLANPQRAVSHLAELDRTFQTAGIVSDHQ